MSSPLAPTPAARRAVTAATVALLLAVPAAALHGGLWWLGFRLGDYAPVTPNDEIIYHLQIQSFAGHGLAGGYYTIGENPAPGLFGFRHPFGCHGPAFPAVYGG